MSTLAKSETSTMSSHNISDADLELQPQTATHLKEIAIKPGQQSNSIGQSSNRQDKDPCSCFSTERLPKVLKNYINSISKISNTHPIMSGTGVLTSISGVVGRRIYIPNGTYFQDLHPVLWTAVISESGSFKTTTQNLGSRPLMEIAIKIRKQIKKIEDQISSTPKEDDKKPLQQAIAALEQQDPLLPNKATAEALLKRLSKGGGAVFSSELGAWLQNLEKTYNNDMRAILTDLFDCPRVWHKSTKTGGDNILEKPFFSLHGCSTIEWIIENFKPNDVSSGFFARFLLYSPLENNNIPLALPGENVSIDLEAEQEILELLENMKSEYRYQFSNASKKLFEFQHEQLYEIIKKKDESIQSYLNPYLKRWSPYILKIACLLSLFENPNSNIISVSALTAAWSFVEAAVNSTIHLFEGSLGESQHQRECRKILNWVVKRVQSGKKPLRRDLVKSKQLPGDSKHYDSVITTLLNSGDVTIHGEGTNLMYVPNIQ